MNTTTEKPSLTFYHANAKRTGGAVKFALCPATAETDGHISLTLANQTAEGLPRFDWQNAITVKLDFVEVCKVLQVLRGECESIDDGRGTFHRSPRHATVFVFRHVVEPVSCYSLEVSQRDMETGAVASSRFVLTMPEAIGVCCSLEQSMGVLAFGKEA